MLELRSEEINAEKILAVEDTTYAVADFNLMTSSQLGTLESGRIYDD